MASLDDLLLEVEGAQRASRQQATRLTLHRPTAPEARAVVLVTTVYTCECGRVYRSPNPHVLVRYDRHGFENSIHYSRATIASFSTLAALPREHKLLERTVPYCEACFEAQAGSRDVTPCQEEKSGDPASPTLPL